MSNPMERHPRNRSTLATLAIPRVLQCPPVLHHQLQRVQRGHLLAQYWRHVLHRFLDVCGRKSDDKCPEPLDLRHLQCCHFAVVFGKFTHEIEFQSIVGWGVVHKLFEVVDTAEILWVSHGTVRSWAAV